MGHNVERGREIKKYLTNIHLMKLSALILVIKELHINDSLISAMLLTYAEHKQISV